MLTGVIRDAVEGRNYSLNLGTGHDPYPYPRSFTWTKNGVQLRNNSKFALVYPSVLFFSVSRHDSGNYSLNASNYRFDSRDVEVGRAIGSARLNVLCECPEFPNKHLSN